MILSGLVWQECTKMMKRCFVCWARGKQIIESAKHFGFCWWILEIFCETNPSLGTFKMERRFQQASQKKQNLFCCTPMKHQCRLQEKILLIFFRYNSSTGIFTVPSGGDGLYYFSTYLLVFFGETAFFNIRVNGEILCSAWGDEDSNSGSDIPQATCSGLAQLNEGGLFVYREFITFCLCVLWLSTAKNHPIFSVSHAVVQN